MILDKVGLGDLSDRKIEELSGGQRQRVAIARALIKNPKIIFADEPTGNLDNKTTAQILKLLKSLSADRLVLVVSHNQESIIDYSDRIITLADGQVVSDITRYEDTRKEIIVNNGEVFIPRDKKLNEDDMDLINDSFEDNPSLKIRKVDGVFRKTPPMEETGNKPTLSEPEKVKSRLASHKAAKIGWAMIKASKLRFAMSIIITALCVSLFCLGIVLSSYNISTSSAKTFKKFEYDTVVLRQTVRSQLTDELASNLELIIPEETKNKIYSSFDGDVYELYRLPLSFGTMWHLLDKSVELLDLQSEYPEETNGLLLVSEAQVKKILELDEVDYIMGRYPSNTKLEVAITDCFADFLISSLNDYNNYLDVIDKGIVDTFGEKVAVSGIIDTDYEDRYSEILSRYKDSPSGLSDDPNFYSYMFDIISKYTVLFSNNKDFISTYYPTVSTSSLANVAISKVNKNVTGLAADYFPILKLNYLLKSPFRTTLLANLAEYSTLGNDYAVANHNLNLDKYNVYMSTTRYNKLFRTNLGSGNMNGFSRRDVKLTFFEPVGKDRESKLNAQMKKKYYCARYRCV